MANELASIIYGKGNIKVNSLLSIGVHKKIGSMKHKMIKTIQKLGGAEIISSTPYSLMAA